MCAIVSMLSIHMNYRFMVKELPSIPLYKRQCKLSHPDEQQHCNQYGGTIVLCIVSVSMVPVAVAAFLACLIACRILKKKTCYIVWFTFSKVIPARQTGNRKPTRDRRNDNKNVELTKFTQSAERLDETPPTQSDYLPRIPDFTELANINSNQGYRDSLMIENEPESYSIQSRKNIGKSHYSRSLENLEHHQSQGRVNIKDLRGIETNIKSVRNDSVSFDQKSKATHSHRFAHSEDDLRLIQQDHLNEIKRYREHPEYYDENAEDWIKEMVDNFQNSRSRLYGISDEEDLDSDSESIKCSDKVKDIGFSTTKALLSNENKENTDVRDKASGVNKSMISNDAKQKEDKVMSESYTGKKDSGFGLSTKVPPTPPPRNLDKQNTLSEENKKKAKDTIKGAYCAVDIEEVHVDDVRDNKINIRSEVLDNFDKDFTPAGLTTPLAGYHSPNGRLHFEFDKSLSAATQNDRSNWIAFEGEMDRRKLIQGEMSTKEYDDLTSYVM